MQKVSFAKDSHSFNRFLSYDGAFMYDEQDANYQHYATSLGKFEESPFVVGSYSPSNVKVEQYKTSWTTVGDFPYASSFIRLYSTVTIDGQVYIFGELN